MRKPLLLILLLAGTALSARAREPAGPWGLAVRYYRSLTAPKAWLDSARVLQPRFRWTVGVEGSTIRSGVDLESDLSLYDFTGENASHAQGTLSFGMQNRLYKKAGLRVAYGSLGAGYGVEIGRKGSERNTYFTFGSLTPSFGYQIQYYRTHQHVSGTLSMEGSEPADFSSAWPGEMRNIALSGFYAFNRHRFVFSSAYSGRILQRRSAGSWLVTAKYTQGDFALDPRDTDLRERMNDLSRFSTRQFFLGGGYSYNWVLMHRDPADPDTWKGVRNLTANATLLPMVSFLHHIQTEQGEGASLKRIRHGGLPNLSPCLRGAVCYSWDRYCLNLQAVYNRLDFQGADTESRQAEGQQRSTLRTRGVFYDLSAKLQFCVKF